MAASALAFNLQFREQRRRWRSMTALSWSCAGAAVSSLSDSRHSSGICNATPASAEAACLRQPTLQHQQHGSNINISSAHLFQRFSTFNSSGVGVQPERQRHQHLHFINSNTRRAPAAETQQRERQRHSNAACIHRSSFSLSVQALRASTSAV